MLNAEFRPGGSINAGNPFISRLAIAAGVLSILVVLAGCDNNNNSGGGGSATPQSLGTQIDDVVVQVATLTGIVAVFNDNSSCPMRTGSGPSAMTTIFSGAIAGGSVQVTVESNEMFQTIVVVIDGLDGCWILTLPQGVTIEDLLVTLAQDLDQDFVLGFQTGDSVGDFGDVDQVDVVVEPVATSANVQVSLSFDQDTDVDLYVQEPDGTRIFFGAPVSPSGGELDLDSNPGCRIDGINQENISWTSAPVGEYIVLVDYFTSCLGTNPDPVLYTVTIFSNGQLLGTFSDSFVENDVSGGSSPRELTRFSVP